MGIASENFEKVNLALKEQVEVYTSNIKVLEESQECLKRAKAALKVLKEKTWEI